MLFIGYQYEIDIQILDAIFHTSFKHLTRSKMMSREQKIWVEREMDLGMLVTWQTEAEGSGSRP